MSKITLNYDQAHAFVKKNNNQGFYWDNYTIVKWTPGHNGYMQKNGMFKNNQWGYALKYEVNSFGTWEISEKYAKLI
jgi:hypothetical protein